MSAKKDFPVPDCEDEVDISSQRLLKDFLPVCEPTAKLQPISPDGDCADECFLCVRVSASQMWHFPN